jgi:serine/threonine protein kinase
VALKILDKHAVPNRECLKNEPEILRSLGNAHDAIVALKDHYDSEDQSILILELYVIIVIPCSSSSSSSRILLVAIDTVGVFDGRLQLGDLYQAFTMNTEFFANYNEANARTIASKVLSAIGFLHNNDIVHGDISVCWRHYWY